MTFFSKLFRKRPVAAQIEAPAMGIASEISKDLFIEERHPRELEVQQPQQVKTMERTILETLLERDYRAMGHRDGYHMHHFGRMDLQLEVIAADFRQAYDMALQDVEIQLEDLSVHLSDRTASVAPDLHEKIQSKYDQLVRQKRELMLQKDLAMTGEGYVERSAKYYKAGFREGYDLYIQEELIFKHIKTI